VLKLEAVVEYPPPGWRDIRSRLDELERDPKRSRALARARQKLAEELHPPRSLAALRLKKGLSKTVLAQRIGTTQSRLSMLEAGLDEPFLRTAEKLAEALEIPLGTVAQAFKNRSAS
jgi:ribosome-binding protein aMBF1 (putative translation factor)